MEKLSNQTYQKTKKTGCRAILNNRNTRSSLITLIVLIADYPNCFECLITPITQNVLKVQLLRLF